MCYTLCLSVLQTLFICEHVCVSQGSILFSHRFAMQLNESAFRNHHTRENLNVGVLGTLRSEYQIGKASAASTARVKRGNDEGRAKLRSAFSLLHDARLQAPVRAWSSNLTRLKM
jgi:hypothetical protein